MKKTSIFRKSFIFPSLILIILITFYFFFLFETHLKYILEKSAFESLGTEVNISKIEIKPLSELIKIKRIQFTDPDKPLQNIFEIDEFSLNYQTKKLISLSLQSDLSEIKNIKFHTPRKYPGKVLSKEKRILTLKDPSTHKISQELKNKFNKNSFLNLVKSLKGDYSKEELKLISNNFESAKFFTEIEHDTIKVKNEIKDLKSNLETKEVKNTILEIKNFKFNSESRESSLKSTATAFEIIKNAEKQKSSLKEKLKAIKGEVNSIKLKAKSLPEKLMQDILNVKKDFKSLAPDILAQELFGSYFSLQLANVSRFKSSLKSSVYNKIQEDSSIDIKKLSKSIPNKDNSNSSNSKVVEDKFSRKHIENKRKEVIYKKGRWFNFKKNQEPKYWLKQININSQASKGQDLGDVKGFIKNLSSETLITKKPIEISLKGSAPKQDIGSFFINVSLNRTELNQDSEELRVKVNDYKVKDFSVLKDSDAFLNYQDSQAVTELILTKKKDFIVLKLQQTLVPKASSFKAKNKIVEKTLSEVSKLSPINFKVTADGDLSDPKIKITSNITTKILDSLKKFSKNSAKQKIYEEVNKYKEKAVLKNLSFITSNLEDQKFDTLDQKIDSLFKKEIERLKIKVEKEKEKKLEKIKDKLLKKIKF